MNKKEIVVVTGFGPFRQFLENPSWTAAQGLKVAGLGERLDVSVKELPVSYPTTHQIINAIWTNLKPKFAVHVGIGRGSSAVILEQTGKNSGYRERDVSGICPTVHCCIEAGPEKLDSVVNMKTHGDGCDLFKRRWQAVVMKMVQQLEDPEQLHTSHAISTCETNCIMKGNDSGSHCSH